MDEKLVSICCISYNHEKYIKSAIDSFLEQTYINNCEILIHDDASTDNTLEIINSYAKKYPKIIKVMTEKDNKYPTEGNKMLSRIFQEATGKYIALCEGDDYWIDDEKIKKQVEIMENHPEYSMCCHAAKLFDCRKKKFVGVSRFFNESRTITEDMIIQSKGCKIPTASLFFRKGVVDNMPDYFYDCPVGDYALQLTFGIRGEIYYYDKPMAVYRTHSVHSMVDYLFSNTEQSIKFYIEIIHFFKIFSQYTEYAYRNEIEKEIQYYEYCILIAERKISSALKRPYRRFFLHQKPISMMKVLFNGIFPTLYENLKVFKNKE